MDLGICPRNFQVPSTSSKHQKWSQAATNHIAIPYISILSMHLNDFKCISYVCIHIQSSTTYRMYVLYVYEYDLFHIIIIIYLFYIFAYNMFVYYNRVDRILDMDGKGCVLASRNSPGDVSRALSL